MRLNIVFTGLFEKDTHLLFIVAGLCILVLVFLIISLCVSHKYKKIFPEQIQDLSKTIRIYILDVRNDRVGFFNSAKLRKRKTATLTSFYNQFYTADRDALITWIGNLVDGVENTPQFFEVGTYIKKERIIAQVILIVQKIDRRKDLIYLESHMLKYTPKKAKNGETLGYISKKEFLDNVSSHQYKGYSYCINFFNKNNKTDNISLLAYIELRNILCTYISNNVDLCEIDGYKIFVSNFENENKIQSLQFIDKIKTEIYRYLSIESYDKDIDFCVGATENDRFKEDIGSLVKSLDDLSIYAKNQEQFICFYDYGRALLNEESMLQYRTEVQSIIHGNKLRYLFSPLFDISNHRIFGYFSSAEPINSFVKTMDELKNYALRTEDDKELFSAVAKNTITNFSQEVDNHSMKLFIPISFNEMPYVNRTLAHISFDTNIVLVLKEKEFAELGDIESILSFVLSFKTKGYQVALEIDDTKLTLPSHVYQEFGYFVINTMMFIDKKHIELGIFQGLIEKLLHYQKQILAIGIPSWDIIELVYKLGISLVCSNAIAEPSANIMPIERKIYMKLGKLKS